MSNPLITTPIGLLAVLVGVKSFFFHLEKKTRWKVFDFFPPLVFTYAVPMILSNTGIITNKSPLYDWMSQYMLPMFLVLLLLDIDVAGAFRTMGKGIFVMLFGTAGVILGAPVAFFLVKGFLGPDAWKGFGALAGSWIGGTGNMAAISDAIKTPPSEFGLAVLADNMVYVIWLPILLGSKKIAKLFNKFAKVDPRRIQILEETSDSLNVDKGKFRPVHLVILVFLGTFFPWLSGLIAQTLPVAEPILTASSYKILLITTFGILLSLTPARRIPKSHQIGLYLVYLFVAKIGAQADISGIADQAPWFLLGAFIWIFLHGFFCVIGARILHVDVHSTAIASAANVGAVASAPIVAACHNEKLVPVSILMALIGYALGNYGALAAAWLCYAVSG